MKFYRNSIVVLFIILSFMLAACSGNYWSTDIESPEKEMVVLYREYLNIGNKSKLTTNSASNNITVVVPPVEEFNVTGNIIFQYEFKNGVYGQGYYIINVKNNTFPDEDYEVVVLRMYTNNAPYLEGLIGENYDTVPLKLKSTAGESASSSIIPNKINDSSDLFDYLALKSFKAPDINEPRAVNELTGAFIISNLKVYLKADFINATPQTYSTQIIIELVGILR